MDMTKKRAAVTGIIVATSLIVSIYVVVPMTMSSMLTWSISFDDRITYRITVAGWELNETYVEPSPLRYTVLDGINVSATIVFLPEMGFFLNGDEFKERVILVSKVNTTFQNGSLIPNDLAFRLNSMLSRCILPTGAWSLIDIFYPDTYNTEPSADTYLSYDGTISFHFGYYSYGFDSTTLMSSSVSYETGLPSVVSYRYRHGIDAELNITLAQV